MPTTGMPAIKMMTNIDSSIGGMPRGTMEGVKDMGSWRPTLGATRAPGRLGLGSCAGLDSDAEALVAKSVETGGGTPGSA